MKVVHIITGLNTGGAEILLYKLLDALAHSEFTCEVISLTDIGAVGLKIESMGIRVRSLGMQRGVPNPLAVLKLIRWLRQSQPDVVQTWMYHADLIGGLAGKFSGGIPLAWGVHNSNLDPGQSKTNTILTMKICAWLSNWLPTKIVYCSDAAKKVHVNLGYSRKKSLVIPNGIDVSIFKEEPSARTSIRKELGLSENTMLIGLVARFCPQKDHRTFIQAAKQFNKNYPDTHFLLCGEDISWDNKVLSSWIKETGLEYRFHLLGCRQDIEVITSSLDIATSTSVYGESFSLTLGEAMACRVPCVTTDIEGPVTLLGGHGWVVPAADSQSVTNAWQEIIETSEDVINVRLNNARDRIHNYFSLEAMNKGYQLLFTKLNSNI